MNQWKSGYAVKTKARTLADAMKGADVFFGLSAKGAVTQDMVKSMAAKPIIFAMANPDPEITAEEVADVRDDAIMATGRSDYPNQVNNVLGFPYIFRGALDVRASTINMEMKIAAARALAALAREDVPDEVAAAYGARPKFGPDYIIPVPFDPRLISTCPAGGRQGGDGYRRRAQADRRHGRLPRAARSRRDPIAGTLVQVYAQLRRPPKRVVFAEGEEEQVIRAAASFVAAGPRHGAAGRPRGPRARPRPRSSASSSATASRSSMRGCRHRNTVYAQLSLRAAAAPRLSAARLPAAGEYRPQPFRRLHGRARRRRRHGDRRHPQFLGRARGCAPRDRSQARSSRHRRLAGAGARPHRAWLPTPR